MLTITHVTDCDDGTYSCYVFSSVNVRKYQAASVTVTVKDCEKNTYGPECSDKCGRCAVNQTCNTTTGHCPACLDGWTPPLCIEAVPEEPLLTPNEKAVVGVAVGGAVSWGFIAGLVQLCQILGNAGWMPFLSLGGKEEEKEKNSDDLEESADEEEPPSKCSRFLKCIFCGGAGICFLSFLFCISRGKLMSEKFSWRKETDNQEDVEAPPPDNNMTDQQANRDNPEESADQEEVILLPSQKHTATSQSDLLKSDGEQFTYCSVERLPSSSSLAPETQSQTKPDNLQGYFSMELLYHR
ncbi:uncharacterized protein [Littorina saxatilis]|uniref:uncharacterized protein n=1 Tax=Littorina saxatilis TaxID=31220 RepID=UPI0038B50318